MNKTPTQDIRWIQRFENYQRAFTRLENTFIKQSTFNDLEKEGIIKRFQYVFTLAYKTLEDYLEYVGYTPQEKSPRFLIKKSLQVKIINNGEQWEEMLSYKNLLTHTYNIDILKPALIKIEQDYIPLLKELYLNLQGTNPMNKSILSQAIDYQKQHDHIWTQDISHNPEYQTIKANLISQAKDCTFHIKEYESTAESHKAEDYIKQYSQIIEIYREFYYY